MFEEILANLPKIAKSSLHRNLFFQLRQIYWISVLK